MFLGKLYQFFTKQMERDPKKSKICKRNLVKIEEGWRQLLLVAWRSKVCANVESNEKRAILEIMSNMSEV